MFDFEKLDVYKKAKTFNSVIRTFIKDTKLDNTPRDQLRRASFSIVLNLAEGSGRFSHADRKNFYVISRCLVNTFAQSKGSKSIEGTIIFPVTDSIPQGIIFIPTHPDGLLNEMSGQWLYFQSMKWTQEELLWEITRCKKERVVVEGIDNHLLSLLYSGTNECYISFGRLNLRVDDKPDENEDFKEYSLNLSFGGSVYYVKYKTAPRSFGIPISFECLNW